MLKLSTIVLEGKPVVLNLPLCLIAPILNYSSFSGTPRWKHRKNSLKYDDWWLS